LGQLMKIGMPVAKGIVITTKVYREFLVESGIIERIFLLLKNYETRKIESVSNRIEEIMTNYPMPEGIKEKIMGKIRETGMKRVVVRASSIDGKSSKSFVNLRGEDEIIRAVKKCWASLYSPQNLKFKTRKLSNDSIAVVVVVQPEQKAGGII